MNTDMGFVDSIIYWIVSDGDSCKGMVECMSFLSYSFTHLNIKNGFSQ
jgi:hypothetical protein